MSNQPRKPNGQYDFDPNAGSGDLPSLDGNPAYHERRGEGYDPDESPEQHVAHMRDDIRAFKESGEIPEVYDIDVRAVRGPTRADGAHSDSWDAEFHVTAPKGARWMVPDMYDLTHANSFQDRHALDSLGAVLDERGVSRNDDANYDAALNGIRRKMLGGERLTDAERGAVVEDYDWRRVRRICEGIGEKYTAKGWEDVHDETWSDGEVRVLMKERQS